MTLLLSTYNRFVYFKKSLPKIIKATKINNCQLLIIDNRLIDEFGQYLNKLKKNIILLLI
jgi:hypothetical protein